MAVDEPETGCRTFHLFQASQQGGAELFPQAVGLGGEVADDGCFALTIELIHQVNPAFPFRDPWQAVGNGFSIGFGDIGIGGVRLDQERGFAGLGGQPVVEEGHGSEGFAYAALIFWDDQ